MLLGPLVFVCFSCVRAFYTFSREMLRMMLIFLELQKSCNVYRLCLYLLFEAALLTMDEKWQFIALGDIQLLGLFFIRVGIFDRVSMAFQMVLVLLRHSMSLVKYIFFLVLFIAVTKFLCFLVCFLAIFFGESLKLMAFGSSWSSDEDLQKYLTRLLNSGACLLFICIYRNWLCQRAKASSLCNAVYII